MANFFLFLSKSSLCLVLLYAGYYFLFRKETYFNFIRLYLILSIILALAIPVIRLNFSVANSNKLSQQVESITKFKSYYEELIYLTDPEFVANADKLTIQSNAQLDLEMNNSWGSNLISRNLLSIGRIVITIYLIGVLFFLLRLTFLLVWLKKTISKNEIKRYGKFKLVLMQEDVASFSFMKYIFINRNTLTQIEFKQILVHELTHINQRHSFDLLIVQMVGILQWFNPIVWRLNKAFKTTHEYIADRKVVEQGYKLLDYQSLLLRQLISIRSVELVNNFNLLSIKKRIAMMNKMKSGFFSKAKATIAIPLIALSFFLIADLSCKNETETEIETFVGNTPQKFQVNLPQLSQAKPMLPDYSLIKISLSGTELRVNGSYVELNDLSNHLKTDSCIKELKSGKKYYALLEIDQQCSMKEVSQIKELLRENNILKILYMSNYSNSEKNKNTNTEIIGIPQLLPPQNAKLLDTGMLRREGLGLYVIQTYDKSKSLSQIKTELKEFITHNNKYVLSLEYNNGTKYDKYMKYTNIVYETFYELRNAYAQQTLGIAYIDLSDDKQKSVRNKYPITLTQKNIDWEKK